MQFAILILGALLIVAAFNGTYGDLAKELEADIPGFFKWAAAVAIILGLGYVPGLKTPSRWLLALVALVVVVTQYQAILSGFQNFATSGGSSTASGGGNPDPTTAYATNPAGNALPSQTLIAGESGATGGATQLASGQSGAVAALPFGALNPVSVLANFSHSIGFGGINV